MKTFILIMLSLVFVSCEEKPVEVGVEKEEVSNLDETPEEVIEEKIEVDERCSKKISQSSRKGQQKELGIEQIIQNEMYISYSGMDQNGDGLQDETANTYIIKGKTIEGITKVHLFGTGYGDPNSGIPAFRPGQDSITPNSVTASDIDLVIRSCMQLKKEKVEIDFITPHYHIDHINQGFFTELNNLGYKLYRMSIKIHMEDYTPLLNMNPEGYIPWESATLTQFELIGANNNCDEIAASFETDHGRWEVYNNPGHTNGAVYLKNEESQMAITGAPYMDCLTPVVETYFHIHGNISFSDAPKAMVGRSARTLSSFNNDELNDCYDHHH